MDREADSVGFVGGYVGIQVGCGSAAPGDEGGCRFGNGTARGRTVNAGVAVGGEA